MAWLGVIGNVSVDTATYQDGASFRFAGGAALLVSLAASTDRPAAPIAVVGSDLAWLPMDKRLARLDVSSLLVSEGSSCSFHLDYDAYGRLTALDSVYGVATKLTGHALAVIGRHDRYHVCCRRPLDVPRVLRRLVGQPFSLDFFVSSAAELLAAASPFLTQASTIFVNTAEAELLVEVIGLDRLPSVVITDGPRSARLLRHGHMVAWAEPPVATAVEVTGAGDALAGAFLAHQSAGRDDQQALRHAVAAATASVQSTGLTLPSAG